MIVAHQNVFALHDGLTPRVCISCSFKEAQDLVVAVFSESVVSDFHVAGFASNPEVASCGAIIVVGDVAVFEGDVATHA